MRIVGTLAKQKKIAIGKKEREIYGKPNGPKVTLRDVNVVGFPEERVVGN